MPHSLAREWWFLRRDRLAIATLVAGLALASLTVALGLRDVAIQNASIASLTTTAEADLDNTLHEQSSAGMAAYYSFRLVFAPPGELAFAARGIRDELPWKHRIRLLALEGQIYENDAGNPELAQLGSIDYAFLVSVLAPLLLILMLHDTVDGERRQNRLDLLTATAGSVGPWLHWRVVLRTATLAVVILVPFVVAAVASGASASAWLSLAVATFAYLIAWGLAVMWIARRTSSAATAAATLLGAWTTLVLLVPLAGGALAERRVGVPQGGEILLQQRETVNRAWDLPKAATMDAFLATHPEWTGFGPPEKGFDWRWYYAFQQVGDQSVAELTAALQSGIHTRDSFMRSVAWLSPPLLIDRLYTRLAGTDIDAYQRYETCVREFHAELRRQHYPMIFGAEPYDSDKLLALEKTRACR